MKERRLAAVLLALIVIVTASSVALAAEPYVQKMNVVYAETDGIGLLMDIFTPPEEKNGLAIVDIASGAWHSDRGKINDHKRAQMFTIMCSRGYTVFAVRPGSITKFTAPEMLANLKTAIRWVKAHADEYEIDPDQLGLCGASAGGHLACLVSTTGEDGSPDAKEPLDQYSTRVAATVAFFPPTDFLNWGGREIKPNSLGPISRIVNGLAFPRGSGELSEDELKKGIEAISPARLVTSQCPPLLLVHGDADPVVPLQQSQLMLDALEAAGVETKLIVKKGGGHPWPTIHEEVKLAADWFDDHLAAK